MTATLPDGMEFKNMMVQACTDAVDSTGVWGSQFPEVDGVRNHIVAVTGVRDEVGDIIVPGAFIKTLQRITPKACMGHDWNRAIGEPEAIEELLPGDPRLPREDRFGKPWNPKAGALFARTRYNLAKKDGQDAYADATFHGPRLSCSIGYVDPKDDNGNPIHSYKAIDPDTGLMTRFLPELQLFEYSQVLHGAHLLAGGLKTGQPKRLERKARPSMEIKVRLVRDSAYWGLPLGTPIRPGMKPQGPKARRIAATGQQASDTAGAVEVDANNLRIKPTAKGKQKGQIATTDAFSGIQGLFDEDGDPFDESFLTDDTQKINKGEAYNPLDILVANAVPPAEVEEDLRNADWDRNRLGDAAEEQGQIDSYIADVVDAYREKYNAELVRQNDNGDSEVADPDAAPEEPQPDTRRVSEQVEDERYQAAVDRAAAIPTQEQQRAQSEANRAASRRGELPLRPGETAPAAAPADGEPTRTRISPEDQAEITRLKQDGRDNEAAKLYREALARARTAEGITPEQLSPTRARLRQQGAIPPPPADPNAPPSADLAAPVKPNGESLLALHNGDPVSVRENDGETANVYNMRTEQAYDVPASELLTGGASAEAPVTVKLNDAQREAADLVFGNGEPIEDSGAELTGNGLLITDVAEAINTIDTRVEIFEDNPDQKRRHGRVIKALRAKLVKLAKPGEPADTQAAPPASAAPDAAAPGGDVAAAQPLAGNEDVAPQASTEVVPEGAPGESIVEPGLAPDTTGGSLSETDPALADPALGTPADPGAEQPVDDLGQPLEPGLAEEVVPEPVDTISADDIADTEQSTDASFGLTEAPDGEFEADDDIADRQDRVATLLAQSETGSLDFSDAPDEQLRTTRADVVDELRLQQYLERRRSGERAVTRQQAEAEITDTVGEQSEDTEPEPDPGPKPRPGVAGAAEDLADALDDGDQARIDSATDRLRKSVNRSRSDSEVVAEIRAMVDGAAFEPDALRDVAQRLRDEQRAKRNEGARRRRTARRFERERLRSLLGQVEAEMRNRNLDYDPIPDDDGTVTLDITPAVAWSTETRAPDWANTSTRVDKLNGSGYAATISTYINPDGAASPSEYHWTVLSEDGNTLASGTGTAPDTDSARASVEIALDTQRKLGLVPIDAQIPQGSVPQDTSATPLSDVVDAIGMMRARMADGRQLNPITGQPDPFADDLIPLPVPQRSRFADTGQVHKYLESRGGTSTNGGLLVNAYRWDTAEMTPGGAFVVVDDLKGKPQVVHTVTGATLNPYGLDKSLGRADLQRYATIIESITDRDGQPIDWNVNSGRELVDSLKDRGFVADGDGARGAQDAAIHRLTREKIRAGAFTHFLVLRDLTFTDGITNDNRKQFVFDQHRTLGQLINVVRGKPSAFDKKTLDTAAGARTLAAMGAPDASAALLTRRAAEVREQYGEDAPSHGSAVLESLATGYLGMFSPMRSHGERIASLKAGEQVFLAGDGDELRGFRAIAAPRRDPRGMPSDQIVPVIDEKTGDQKFLHVSTAHFRVEDTEHRTYGHAPLGGDRASGLFAVVGPGEEPPATVEDLRSRQFDDAAVIPQDVLDSAAEVLPESAGETAARRATPTDGVRPPRRRSPAAPRRAAQSPVAPEPVRNEQQLAEVQGRAEGVFLGMRFSYGDKPERGSFESIEAVREHLVNLEQGSDLKVASSARAVIAKLDDMTLSPGGVFLVGKDGWVSHASSGYRVWPPSTSARSVADELHAGGNINQAAGLRVAHALESGVFDGEQLDWSGNGMTAVKQTTEIAKRNDKFHPMKTAQRAAYRDGVLGAAKTNKNDLLMIGSMASDMELDGPNAEAFDRTWFIDKVVDYEGSRGMVPNTKAGATMAKRMALELRLAEPLAKAAPLDAVRRLTRLADELDGKTITTPDPELSLTPSEDLRAMAAMITDVYDPKKISESGRFRQAGMVGQVEITKPKITVGRTWEDPNGIAGREIERQIRDAGGIRFYRDENGLLHATFAGVDITEGQVPVNGSTVGAIKLDANGRLTLSYVSANRLTIIEAGPRSWKFTPDAPETGDTGGDISDPETESAQAGQGDGVDISQDVQEMRRLADVDAEPGAEPAADDAPEVMEKQIRQVYDELATEPQDWIRIARIRAKLGDADRVAFDKALVRMSKTQFVHLAPESNTKVLTEEDRAGALRVGSEDMHLISIEPEDGDAGPATEEKIRQVYRQLAPTPETWVRLVRLRKLLGTDDKAEVDRALLELMKTGTVHLSPDSNTKMLTEEDRAAAVRIGGEDLHLIAIE